MPIFIPDLFSGYVEGRRKAIADNWTDLKDYNNVFGGQLENAFGLQTFDDKARISHDNALVSGMNTALSGATTDLALARALENMRLGTPYTQALSDLAAARNIVNSADFYGKVYNDPNYYQHFVNGTGNGVSAGPVALEDAGNGNGTGVTYVPQPIGQTYMAQLDQVRNIPGVTPAEIDQVQKYATLPNADPKIVEQLITNIKNKYRPQQPQQ